MPFEDNSPSPDENQDSTSDQKSGIRKSRFDDVTKDHNAQMVYSNDTDLRQLLPQQQSQLSNSTQQIQQPQKPAIPNLLDLKVPAPEEFLDMKRSSHDQDFRPFSNFNNDKNQRPSPWATPLPSTLNNMPMPPPLVPPPLVQPQNFPPSLFNTNPVIPENNFNNFSDGAGFNGDIGRDNSHRSSNRSGGGGGGGTGSGSGGVDGGRSSSSNSRNNDNNRFDDFSNRSRNRGDSGSGSSRNRNRSQPTVRRSRRL